jgi:hypothetical protein
MLQIFADLLKNSMQPFFSYLQISNNFRCQEEVHAKARFARSTQKMVLSFDEHFDGVHVTTDVSAEFDAASIYDAVESRQNIDAVESRQKIDSDKTLVDDDKNKQIYFDSSLNEPYDIEDEDD